jgi:hypothetical protein
MQVYVLIADSGYDGQEVLGVYASRDDAVTAAHGYDGTFASEGFFIEAREVGAEPEEGFWSSFQEHYSVDDDEDNFDDSMDGDFDSAMKSAGFGTDEDYGSYGDD